MVADTTWIDANIFFTSLLFRDSTGTGTGTVPAGTTLLRSGLGTFFVPAPDRAKCFH